MKCVGQFAFAFVFVWASTACAFDGEIAFKGISVGRPLKYTFCEPTDFVKERFQECPARAIEVRQDSNDGKEKLLPIDLKCPDENGGILELVSENFNGKKQRLIVIFINAKPSSGTLSYSNDGLKFTTMKSANIENPKTESEAGIGKALGVAGEALNIQVCHADASARRKYMEKLLANRRLLDN